MHASTLSPSVAPAARPTSRSIGLAVFLIVEAILAIAPMAVLGPAIGWPASLGAPPAQQLVAIGAAPQAVTLGYAIYLLYSLLIAPLMIWMASRVLGDLRHPVAFAVAVFGALSALARAIGILRWLTVMPLLSQSHAVAPAADRAAIEQLFSALHAYGGGVGELLGVSLLMAASLGTLCVGGWMHRSMPAWLVLLGLITTAALTSLAFPALGLGPAMPTAVAVTLLSAWMIGAAGEALRRS
jgi:hypothetical protein